MKTLYLQKRGCDILESDALSKQSDCENFRLYVEFTDKKGKFVVGSLTSMKMVRHFTKSGKPLKKFVKTDIYGLSTDLQVSSNIAQVRYSLNISNELRDIKYRYTKEGILKLINSLSIDEYSRIVIY